MDFTGLYQIDHKKKKNKTLGIIKKYMIPLFGIFLVAFVLQFSFRKLLFFPVKVNTNSMEPDISTGDTKFFIYPHLGKISKGDIVFASHGNIDLFCRVAAIEGEVVQILDRSLFINHIEVKNFSASSSDKTSFKGYVSTRDNTEEFLTGPQMYFCLNDNWDNIHDSRTWGPVGFRNIKGKILFK
jgi:signal peptidase I